MKNSSSQPAEEKGFRPECFLFALGSHQQTPTLSCGLPALHPPPQTHTPTHTSPAWEAGASIHLSPDSFSARSEIRPGPLSVEDRTTQLLVILKTICLCVFSTSCIHYIFHLFLYETHAECLLSGGRCSSQLHTDYLGEDTAHS